MKILAIRTMMRRLRHSMLRGFAISVSTVLLVSGVGVLFAAPAWALPASTTTITSVSPPNAQAAGSSVTITATINQSVSDGTVNFEASPDGSTFTTIGTCGTQPVASSTSTCTTTAIPAGTIDLEAVWLGDGSYTGSTSAAFPYSVAGPTAASVGLVVSPASTVVYTNPVTITANLTSGATGTVSFEYSTNGSTYANITNCVGLTVNNSSAVCSANSTLPLGTVDLKADYSGSTAYANSLSPAYPFTVTPGTQTNMTTITSVSPTSPVVVGTPETITATLANSSSGSTVNFEYSTNGSAYSSIAGCSAQTVSGTTAQCAATTALPIGTVDLEAVYSGNGTYAAYTSPAVPFSVITGTTGTTIVITTATPASPQVVGTSVTFTAAVPSNATAAPATVAFQYSINGSTFTGITNCGSQTISGTTATCTTTSLPVATVDVDAVYSGNATYAPATSAAYPYLVRTTSLTTLTVSPVTSISYGSTATLTATVTTGATGTVTFQTSPNDVTFTNVGNCVGVALSAATHTATCLTTTLPTGTYYVDAVYSGDSTYITSTSAAVSYVVHQGTQTPIAVTSVSGVLGQSLTLVTSGGSGTGAITYTVTNGTATGCTVSGATLKATTAGTCLVTATKVADVNYAATTSTTTVNFVNPVPKATRVIGAPYVGRTTVIGIAGVYFYGQPTIKCSVAGFTFRVSKDTGSLLTVSVTVKAGLKTGVRVFALTFKNGQKTNVKFSLR